jgi:hypothetical protein
LDLLARELRDRQRQIREEADWLDKAVVNGVAEVDVAFMRKAVDAVEMLIAGQLFRSEPFSLEAGFVVAFVQLAYTKAVEVRRQREFMARHMERLARFNRETGKSVGCDTRVPGEDGPVG